MMIKKNNLFHIMIAIAILSLCVHSNNLCDIYHHFPLSCVQSTKNIRCQYDYFINKCIENQQMNLGCSEYLNKEACLNQLRDQQNNRVYCIFKEKCTNVKEIQLKQYGCSDMFNKYACLSVWNQSCYWENQRCQQLKQANQDNSQICNSFLTPVNPYTCTQLPSGLCMSNGFDGDFACVELRLDQLSQFSCNQLGLNEEGCLALNQENHYCIFKDSKCQEFKLSEIISCDQNLSQYACLSIKNKDLQCEWINKTCRQYQKDSESNCITKNQVNVSVCQTSTELCLYDESIHKCMIIEKNYLNLIQCNTPGLSKLACLSINNQNCSFEQGKCQELSESDLSIYQCNMDLNKQACVNIKTHFQYCFWNGTNCERRVMNQDYDCPLILDNNDIRVNGNVCQAISKYQKKCKYNSQTHLCIESSLMDKCTTPFINKFGCLSIIKNDETCQWTQQGCQNIEVIQYETTCNSLGSANPIACAQIIEKNEKIGCYFDKLKQQCVVLNVELAQYANKQEVQQYQKDLELLRNLICNQISIGLNKIVCSSITTRDVACRWNKNQCVQIEKRKDIQTIPCLSLKYANPKACSYAQYKGEVCRYEKLIKGCVNSISKNMDCNQLGLNSYGCSQAEGSCQFINDQCQQSEGGQTSIDPISPIETPSDGQVQESPSTCDASSPTKIVCMSFSSISLLCYWSKAKSSCENVEIKQNQNCLDYSGNDVSVNSNVCASIVTDFPDYDYLKGVQVDKNRGYCYYNKQTFQCQIKKEFCNTKCCTESENYGINAHSCIKFSSSEPGDYCYFMNLRCQELKDEIVDLSKLDQIKQYFNENLLPCSSMNKNSCYMIDWSLEQRCYYNGIVCLNIDYRYYKDYRIFTQEPSVLNENACFAIDGLISEQNTLKYVEYDYDNKRCKEIILDNQFSYTTCEEAKGNRNICQRFTGNNNCRWDSKQLKCITIPLDEYDEIVTCESELNIKACSDIKKSSCLFSYQSDRCIDVIDFNVDCNHFQSLGKVSWKVCLQIIKFGQQCEFHNYSCIDSTKVSEACDGSFANNRSCFKNTKGLCRWDPNTFQCYVNHIDISQLSCSDNINIELCKKITKDPCIWNDLSNQCEIFKPINSIDFEILKNTGNHKFNQKACLLITGDAYYYDTVSQKCNKLISKTVDCDTYQLNKYACLYHTRTHHCFYDEQEVVPNKICKPFIQDQSICQTQWQINIEVCMNIQHSCIFDLNTLTCTTFNFLEEMTCSDLLNYSINLQHPNKRVCSSVVQTQQESLQELLCLEDKLNQQKCKFQRYCFWSNYECKFFKILYDSKDSANGEQQTLKECPDYEKISTCTEEVVQDTTQKFRKERKSKSDSFWNWIDETTVQHIIRYEIEHTYYQIIDNLKFCEIHECTILEKQYSNIEQVLEYINPYNEVSTDITDTSSYIIDANNIDEDTCKTLACTQLSEYMCSNAKNYCLQKNNCQMEFDYPYDSPYEGNCIPKQNYILSHWCLLKENKVNVCSNTLSKALCLELSKYCYFDIQQGGCMQLEGNEHNIVDCNQISNTCYVSSSQRAICKNGELSIKPGDQCKIIQKLNLTCVPLTTYQSPFVCSDILNSDVQPILCAQANDDCRYDGKYCINQMPTQKSNGKYPCDKSFSKSICIKCGCDYTYLGYCQEIKQVPQINSDKSNKYFLCYQVNLLNTSFKKDICASVDQACAYVETDCLDATHYACADLLLYPVSLKACQKCQEYGTKYVVSEQKCHKIDNTIESSCDNLNQYACLRNTRGVKCKWDNFNCQTITIQKNDTIKCSILNFDACYSSQVNICWIDQTTSLCVEYDPYKGKCDLLKTESLCVRSMYENCKWSTNICIKNNEIPTNTCDNLNQYLCLNSINIACGWSDLNEKCYELQFKSTPSSCLDYLQSEQQTFINRTNSYTCTQIKVQQGCIHDQYYKCRLIIPLDVISCEVSSISNINEFACAKLAKGKCKFINSVCEKTIESNLGCQAYLNQEACIYQNAACKFDIFCQTYTIESMNDIKTVFPYTSSVCKSANLVVKSTDGSKDIGVSLIYSVAQQKCLDITDKNMIFNQCNYTGMNKYTCLLKTNQFCEYRDYSCRYIEQKVIQSLKTCNPTLNQFSCTRLNISCKFLKGQCVPIDEKDNCIVLSQEKSTVNFRTCLKDNETPCLFNDKTQNCEVITTPQKCKGLNYKGCIFFTQGDNCEFKNSKCITSFGNLQCTDDINEDKCLSIITKGQYCYFDQKNGCKNIDTSKVDINKCYKDGLQTNPSICSKSTDIPCFFDKQNRQCIQYTDQIKSSYELNYKISNIYSLNKLSCQIFNQLKALMWQEGCQVVNSSQLVYLKCSAILNKIACLSIKTPFQYCQYINDHCVSSNLDDFKNVDCDQIKDINSGTFCSQNMKEKACQYNKSLFRCEIIEISSSTTIGCVEKDPEEKGLNKVACEIDKINCTYDENCYRLNKSGFQFCKDIQANGQFQCKQVTGEGCIIESNNCKKIYYENYSKIKCEQASNRFGCVNIQTQDQYCQFDGDQCKLEDVKAYADIGCMSIMNINHYLFCEQPRDIACTFDQKNYNCRNVYPQEEFTCERGLNKIACLTQTTKSLKCQFLDYCYGPNNGILNCVLNDNDKCCREADQIDICLNQKIYNCEWTLDGCRGYQTRIEQCNQIINASFLICASIKDVLCVYVPSEHKCQTQIPTTCGFSQTAKQCTRMVSVSCQWDQEDDLCKYSDESAYLNCVQVNQKSGNQRSCMNIEVQGQLCIYKDEQCTIFVEQQNVNNCLDSINKNACMQQTISDCQWVEQVYQIKKYSYSDVEDIIYGECKQIDDINKISCSQNISYTACLKISKHGEFCIWKDYKCQLVGQQEIYTPNQLVFVNLNACGLINNGDIVKYDHIFKKCVIIDNLNELTCNPLILGINKEACMTITSQPCIWNNIQKICQYSDVIDRSQFCERPYWNYISCSKLDIDLPCGYSNNGCQLVDINTITCTQAGLNKFACLNINNYPCIWKFNEQNDNYYCDDYMPYTSCQLIPINVNSKVCQLVDEDECYYDINNKKCKNIEFPITKCDTLGLNIKGCIGIDGCVFQESCQNVNKKLYYCNEYPIANYNVCKNALDNCKFNDLTSGCLQSNEELCDTKGLSNQGCYESNCLLINNQCQCNEGFIEKDCNQISEVNKCDLLDHCIYIKEKNFCKWKQCEDQSQTNCDGQIINQFYCYLNTSQQCKSAKQCEDISNPASIYPKLNNKPCIYNSDLQLYQLINCEGLDEQICLKNPSYCIFEQFCRFIRCNDMKQINCPSNLCNWNSQLGTCEEQVECSLITDKKQCKSMKNNNRECQWIEIEKQSFCTNSSCRFLSNKQECSGVSVNNEVCVETKDNICLSCEEIQNPCICLQNNQYCDYDFNQNKCESKYCSSYLIENQCPKSHCDFIQYCVPQCKYISNSTECSLNQACNLKNEKCQLTNNGNPPDPPIFNKSDIQTLINVLVLPIYILQF